MYIISITLKKVIDMKLFILFGVILSCVLAGCGSGQEAMVQEDDITDQSYTYEGDGFGGNFTLTINSDGTFQYYEGLLSSYIGHGTWELEQNILTISDDSGHDRVNRFAVDQDGLVFQKEDSSNFICVKVSDGERFLMNDT